MAKRRKKSVKKRVAGNLIFNKLDRLSAKFGISGVEGFVGPGALELSKDLLPDDFELSRYDVKASYVFEVVVKEK